MLLDVKQERTKQIDSMISLGIKVSFFSTILEGMHHYHAVS